jgi:hypothetical protein
MNIKKTSIIAKTEARLSLVFLEIERRERFKNLVIGLTGMKIQLIRLLSPNLTLIV